MFLPIWDYDGSFSRCFSSANPELWTLPFLLSPRIGCRQQIGKGDEHEGACVRFD